MTSERQALQASSFVVTTSNDTYSFSSRDAASDWAVCAVLGGYADWAEVEDLVSGQTCRIVGSGSSLEDWARRMLGYVDGAYR